MKEILLEKYRVIRILGEGGVGNVFLVRNLHLNRLEALKTCKGTKEKLQMLSDEASVLKKLSHPMLPVVYDLFREDDMLCLVIEFIEGITLEAYLQRFGQIEEERAIKWAISLTEVLGYLHEQKPEIIYRDLKPSNIMVLPDGSLKLIDLGAACMAVYGNGKKGLLMGTPGYSAPEQWQGKGACKESDVYAFGMVLHEMLTGLQPVTGCQERRPIREYNKSISEKIEQIIMKCVETQPQQRYHSMEQLQSELQSCIQSRQKSEKKYHIRQKIGTALFFLAMLQTVLPFLAGLPVNEFPFPYLRKPLIWFLAVLFYHRIFLRKKSKANIRKVEKSVFLTEKKFPGLYVSSFFVMVLIGFYIYAGIWGNAGELISAGVKVTAADKAKELWVDMRDNSGRKCLMQENYVFQMQEKVWFEIAKEHLPEGVSRLQLFVTGEDDTLYESRVFFIENN